MYNLLLIISMIVVVLSPVFIDLLLSLQEVRSERHEPSMDKKQGPQYAWASSRSR